MGAKLTPKLILEGTRLTHKTDLAFALNEHPRIVGPRRYRYHSPVVSAEWCAFTDVPWGRGPINYASAEEERLSTETFAAWARLFELNRYYSWMVDRFHVSARVYQRQAHGRDPDFSWLDPRLRAIGFRHVLCVRRPETFEAARAERIKVSGKPSQYDDLGAFVREQDLYRRLVAESRLPWLELDVSDGDVAGAADRVADWLEATGGLSAPWGV
ncbi:MAG TPA: hypothetical protein VML50_16395 [Anaeromyxobacter sp.]|nr:hypothetical protein [Anaeromyxobacter sp.]